MSFCRIVLWCTIIYSCWSGAAWASDAPHFRVRRAAGTGSFEFVTAAPSSAIDIDRLNLQMSGARSSFSPASLGDNVSDPFIVSSLPFSDSRSTVTFSNDYDESCPFPQNGAPDVVYKFTPLVNQTIAIDLCGSSYDTKVYVYKNTVTLGSPYACDDDYCGPAHLQSYIPSLSVNVGSAYYIVVDGYGTSSGTFILSIDTDQPCVWTGCTAGSQPEGEACVTTADVTNGGCSTPGQHFQAVSYGSMICGAIWAELPNRDTDWFRQSLPAGAVVRWTVRAEFPVSVFVFDLANGCSALSGVRIDGNPCEDVLADIETAEAGDYAFVVTTREQYGGYLCSTGPWEYEAMLELMCDCECHADPAQIPSPNQCDGVMNVADIVAATNIAFRGIPSIHDPLSTCPFDRADVDCSGVVNVADIVHLTNVAFRGQPASAQFTNPCTVTQ